MEKQKKTNIFLALFLSLLTAILGATVFGIIYGIGYYIYILSALQIYFTCIVFLKYIKDVKWYHILISLIWGTLISFAFSILAICVCESLYIAKDFNMSFIESFKLLIEEWQINKEVQVLMSEKISKLIAMIAIGGVIIIAMLIASNIKAKKEKQAANSQQKTEELNKPNYVQNLYTETYNAMSKAFKQYANSNNKERFKVDLKHIVSKYQLSSLTDSTKTEYVNLIKEKLNGNISNFDKKVNESLLKLVK